MYANEAMRQHKLHHYSKMQIVVLVVMIAIGALLVGGGATAKFGDELRVQISHLLNQS